MLKQMILPSSTLRSQFIKTLELGEDPKNKYIYKVIEKRLSSNSFAKVAVNDLNPQPDAPAPIKLENVPDNMFKSENVNKANINKSMKTKYHQQ